MNTSKWIVIVIIFLFLTAPAYSKSKEQAQRQLTADDIVAKMQKQLELTDQQALAVKPIVENYLAEEQEIKQEEKKALSKVLTDQQLYTWNFLQSTPTREKKKKLF